MLFVNVPIGLIVLLLAPALSLPETPRQPGRFDLAGALTSTLGMASLVYGFVRAATDGWSDGQTIASFAAGRRAARRVRAHRDAGRRQPITPLRLFADRNRSRVATSLDCCWSPG